MSVTVFLLLASLGQYHIVHSTQCNRNVSADDSISTGLPGKDGFSAVLSVGRSFREGFFGISLSNYDRLRSTIAKLYNGSFEFSDTNFISTALHYCREAEFLAAFVLILAVLAPLVAFLLWWFWEKCYDPNEENGDGYLNRHLSLVAQLISWGLGCSIVSTLLVIAAFSIILLIGNERVGLAVEESKVLISGTLPMIRDLHDQFIFAVNNTLVIKYQDMNHSIYNNELSVLNGNLTADTNTSLFENFTVLLNDVSSSVSDVGNVKMKMQGLSSFHTSLLSINLSELIFSVSSDVLALSKYCNETEMYLVNEACLDLVTNSTIYLPKLSPSLTAHLPNTTLLDELLKTVTEVVGVANSSVIADRQVVYDQFLNEVEHNVSESMLSISGDFLQPLNDSVSSLFNMVDDHFGDRFTYGLPESQELVERALGDEYLNNWQEFRHLFTIAFSVSLFIFCLGVVVAVGRGLLNIGAIYLYGEEPEYARGGHMAALMLKNLAIWISIVGVVSSFFFVFIMCLASIVGRACGIHGNYSEVIDEIIDYNGTWGGVYPIGLAYFNDPTHPLTLHSILASCSERQSVVEAIGVSELLNFDSLNSISEDTETKYITDMKGIPTLVALESYSALGAALEEALSKYQSVSDFPWSNYLMLERDIFDNGFIGLESLSSHVSEIMDAVTINETLSEQLQTNLTNLLQKLNSSLEQLVEESNWYTVSLSEARTNASWIQQALKSAHNVSNVKEDGNQFESSLTKQVDQTVKKYALEAAINIIELVKGFSSSSVYNLSCNTASCFPVAQAFNNFSSITCQQFLDGLDLYWNSVLAIFLTCLPAVLLMIFLARYLSDRGTFYNQQRSPASYHTNDYILIQIIRLLWSVLVFSINLWFVVAIMNDKIFTSYSCENQQSSCCSLCLWIIGLLFIVFTVACVVSLTVYQWVVLYRIKSSKGVKVQQIQRYWLARLKAAVFYEKIVTFFFLHVPFLAISGSFSTTRGLFTPSSFASLFVSLLGILFLFLSLIIGRGEIIDHLNLLQQEITSCCYCYCWKGRGGQYGINEDMTGNEGRNGSIQMTAINPVRGHVVGDSDHIREYIGADGPPLEGQGGPISTLGLSPPVREGDDSNVELETSFIEVGVTREDIHSSPMHNGPIQELVNGGEAREQTVEENCEDQQPVMEETHLPSVMLDRVLSDAELLKQRQVNGEAVRRGGAKLARPNVSQYTDWEGSTPRSSVCMSEDSMTGSEALHYHSTSHILGYTSTDESSTYRDDDSYESDHGNYLSSDYFHVDGKQVEV